MQAWITQYDSMHLAYISTKKASGWRELFVHEAASSTFQRFTRWAPIWDFSIFTCLSWDKTGENLTPQLQAPDSPSERLQLWLSPPAEVSGAISILQSPDISPRLVAPRDCTVACPRARSGWGQRRNSPSSFWGLRLRHWCYRRSAK